VGRVTRGMALALALAVALAPASARAARVRAAYAYEYMPASHVDSLADRGFTRVLVHAITDSLDPAAAARRAAWRARGAARGVAVVPEWAWHARARLSALGGARRYAPDDGRTSDEVPCPLDSAYWRSALLDRAEEYLADGPAEELALDLELYWGPRHHLDGGACRCDACVAEYLAATPAAARVPERRRLAGMAGFQEARLARVLTALLREFAARHPGVRLAVLDLDYDAFPHRALARALARAAVPTADYCERSYAVGGTPLRGARARLRALGLPAAPLIGGVWLGRFTPRDLVPAMASIDDLADGTWVFTTYSLWQDPVRLTGPYALLGGVAQYWDALARANPEP
jgi:hypothetical protein